MVAEFDKSLAPSPRESMHSELLLTLNKGEITSSSDGLGHTFEIAGWFKLKNTHDLPALLIMEQSTQQNELWYLIDTARVSSRKGVVLMSGRVETKETRIAQINLYLCHPNPDITIDVDELRFNGQMYRKDFVEAMPAAG